MLMDVSQEVSEIATRNSSRHVSSVRLPGTKKIIGKGITVPLRILNVLFMKKGGFRKLKKMLQFEPALCEKTDALALAGHMQAIADIL
jgi:hypothetical protein